MSTRRRVTSNAEDAIKVFILPLGGETTEVVVEKGSSVADALKAAKLDFDDKTEVRSKGEILESNMEVEEGESLVISSAGKIEGGN